MMMLARFPTPAVMASLLISFFLLCPSSSHMAAAQEPEMVAKDGSLAFSVADGKDVTFSLGSSADGPVSMMQLAGLEARLSKLENAPPPPPPQDAGGVRMTTVTAQGAGWCVKNNAKVSVTVDGVNVLPAEVGTGIYLVAFDPETFETKSVELFNTFADPAAEGRMASWIDALADGTPVAAALWDEGSEKLTQTGCTALSKLGAAYACTLKLRESWALVGRKGLRPGHAAEDHGTDSSVAAPTATRYGCNAYAGRPTRVVTRTFFRGAVGAQIEAELDRRTGQVYSQAGLTSMRVVARSFGFCEGNRVELSLDGQAVTTTQTRGLHTFVLNEQGIARSEAFDMFDYGRRGAFAAMIEDVADGAVVVVLAMDSVFTSDSRVEVALAAIGAASWHMVKYRASYAIIGRKGAAKGSVPEDVGVGGEGAVRNGCRANIYAGRPTRTLTEDVFHGRIGALIEARLAAKAENSAVMARLDQVQRERGIAHVTAQGMGYCAGNAVRITLNGEALAFDDGATSTIGKRGLNVAAVDPETLAVIWARTYDTYGDVDKASAAVASDIAALPVGTIVAAALGDATKKVLPAALAAFASCGSALLADADYRDGWAMIGSKGLRAGEALEDHAGGATAAQETCDQSVSGSGTRVLKQTLVSTQVREYLAQSEGATTGIPEVGLELLLDASSASSGATIWKDSSGKGHDASVSGTAPSWSPAFGGVFNFVKGSSFQANVGNAKSGDFSAVWCGVNGRGDDNFAGISRGLAWGLGNVVMGYRAFAMFDKQERPEYDNHIAAGDNFCNAYVVNEGAKTVDIFVNGLHFGKADFGVPNELGTAETWSIGNRVNKHQYLGGISHVAVYSRQLSSREISRAVRSFGLRIGLFAPVPWRLPVPGSGLVGHYDAAASAIDSTSTSWPDASVAGNDIDLNSLNAAPTWQPAFNGYFDFAGGKGLSFRNIVPNSATYTVFWCGVNAGGNDPFGGVIRGNAWRAGNHLVGWQTGAVYGDGGTGDPERASVPELVEVGDNFCWAHTNHVPTRTITAYLNGDRISSWSYTTWAAAAMWTVGFRSAPNDHAFTGGVGVLLIYQRALAPAEIRDLHAKYGPRFGLPASR